MNVITDTLRQIVRRKLWPVALVLIAALAAVPFVLAKNPESGSATAATHAAKVEPVPATFVSAPDAATEPAKRRRVLGGLKDPFAPAELPKVKKAKKKKAEKSTKTSKTDTPTTGSAPGGATSPPASPQPTATPAPTITVPAYSIRVRFGTTDSKEAPEPKTIQRLFVLPDEATPVLVYRGVEDGGKVAVFELTGDVEAQGDGECKPRPEDCQYVRLNVGETEFITVSGTGDEATDAQYQLDLVKIYKKQTKEKVTDPAAPQTLAKAGSSSLTSKTEGFKLRRRNRYVFDATTGTLRLAKGQKTPVSAL